MSVAKASRDSSSAPQLLVLEGPAGTGKSTLSRELVVRLQHRGLQAGYLSEFSSTPLGGILESNAQYGVHKQDWCLGLGGLLGFLADKVHQLEWARDQDCPIWVSDRFVSSQLVLGLRGVRSPVESAFGAAIIRSACTWSESIFDKRSLLVFLRAPAQVLGERLEARIGRCLSAAEWIYLSQEIEAYDSLACSASRWETISLDARRSLPELLEYLEGRIET
jgi:thymidylate kinase